MGINHWARAIYISSGQIIKNEKAFVFDKIVQSADVIGTCVVEAAPSCRWPGSARLADGFPARRSWVSQFMVGRQPVFDAKLGVHGYELLFRGTASPTPAGDVMTADVLVHAGLDVGLGSLVGNKLAFVNATRAFLVGEHEVPLPPRQTVIEVLDRSYLAYDEKTPR